MKVIAVKPFLHDKLGRVQKDSIIDLADFQAKSLEKMGLVKVYSTKVIDEVPENKIVEEIAEKKVSKRKQKASDIL